jgi:ribosomal protein L37AE/L43A
MEAQPDYPIETFDSLLRDLVCWGLVTRDEGTAEARWQLVPAAHRRLEELHPASPPHAVAVVYLDHRCADCRQRGPTRIHEDSYLCQNCWADRESGANIVATEPPSERQAHSWRRSRSSQTTTTVA